MAQQANQSLLPAIESIEGMNVDERNLNFNNWVKAFRQVAVEKGISGEIYDSAFSGISYNEHVIERDRNQTELTKPIWEYLDITTSQARVAGGIAAYEENKKHFDRIEARYGVDAHIILAIWGLESAYGATRGDIDTIEALATLAFDGRRKPLFESQLIAALSILQSGDVERAAMKGSWAGAMGHTQFMPTSFLSFAEDYNGDGKRDIWGSDPTDALASTANYLAKHGWTKGQPWGAEVILPDGFDHRATGKRTKKPIAVWHDMGVRTVAGDVLPDHGEASIIEPAGHRGAAFVVFDNFNALASYNASDAYVIAVGHLADLINGGPPIKADWPREDTALSSGQKSELQALLTAKGFDSDGVDGILGANSIAAIRAYQLSTGQIADGYPSVALLNQLR